LYFLYRGYRDRRYFRSFGERLGWLPATYKRTAPGSIWLHAVSVGEIISSLRLVNELRAANPHIPIYVSTTTVAGRSIAEEKLAATVDGLFYAPIDYTSAVRRVLRRIRPAVFIVLETEIWPNLYREVKRAGCGLLIMNGRISDRTLARYRRFRLVFRAALSFPDAIFAQSESDRTRYLEIGAPADRVSVGGNLKYDAAAVEGSAPPQAVVDLIARIQPGPIWIAASTMPGADADDPDESEVVLSGFLDLATRYPRSLLIIAPRKPERFDIVFDALRARGIHRVRRSQLDPATSLELPGAMVLDTIGELASVFALADVVFMGGTLARRGGHNILEPAAASRPIVIGPHMENFAAIAQEFRAAGALVEIKTPSELAPAIDNLFQDPQRRAELGQLAAQLAERKRGVTARAVREILAVQDRAIPAWNLHGFGKSLLAPLSLLWIWGGALKQRKASRALETPVISVGGIAMGGSGKTPFVLMLARRLNVLGFQPAILTRGYGRQSLARMIVVEGGGSASTAATGDEAQIFVRSGDAHVGICSDRWRAGCAIEEASHTNVFLLDDGFQHRRLQRDLDIVLIDAFDPFAGGAVFPRGRLREPLAALARADMFVITRAQPGRHYQAIRERLGELNPNAPIFLSTVEPRRWIHAVTGQESQQPSGPVVAFCGLGNPDAYWQTLNQLGIHPVFTWSFRDHHLYRPRELRRLAAQARSHGAAALVTSEKDAMNLPADFAELIAPTELYWLEVETRLHDETALMHLVGRAIFTDRPRASQTLSKRQA
jgi:tetraacyldisaccharide 4'-kinase